MQLPLTALAVIAWLFFLAYWLWSARRLKPPSRAEPALPRLLKYWLPIALAIALMWPTPWLDGTVLGRRLLPWSQLLALAGLWLIVAGVLFACWARHVLGSNWSSEVQLKQGHELIERGPYRWVRHPIYTGILLALLGTVVLIDQWRALLGFAIMAASFWRKLRLEEAWLGEHFGAVYADYKRRVRALVPGLL